MRRNCRVGPSVYLMAQIEILAAVINKVCRLTGRCFLRLLTLTTKALHQQIAFTAKIIAADHSVTQ